ncbi:hypothetical protein D8B26_003590 [Coccidioides posadasii str. Silveira]|uniref:Uncharacterized protein n=2 Tax=Coccidioides posadasii TaxID=199306 RepID=E9D0R3_COCPS|nr:hypothetical protein CPSG_03092 [Coccidioides posadasii str. Silveira]KMM73514.1 DUF974 domain-containing protein [Coccidioides posadasii RMSCC 3488]QVM08918.1 hypothetical protein D8B26_003590 [Coccidioides posadasii str. Silveira]
MARSRALSAAEGPKEPHSVSLKVLRLSRPSLSYQHPLPEDFANVPVQPSLSYPSSTADKQFILSPNLMLPPAFGSAYVGETFSCSLSANNEFLRGDASRVVTSIRILAEMQTPSQVVPLELYPSSDDNDTKSGGIAQVESMQRIVRFDLKEEGNHVLAVGVSYTETMITQSSDAHGSVQASGGRVRTFRKLYQFVAQPCLNVRTKATELPPQEVDNRSLGPYGKTKLYRFALEAQLENVGDGIITLGAVTLNPKPPFKSRSLNWDFESSADKESIPTLSPRDVLQIAFIVEQEHGQQDGLETLQKDMNREGRATLGQLSLEWRSALGDRGFLTTGNLMTKKR